MRTIAALFATAATLLTACSSTYQATMPKDDVYNSSRENSVSNQAAAPVQPANTGSYSQPATNSAQQQETYTEYSEGEYIPQNQQGQNTYSTQETYSGADGSTYVTNNYYGSYNPDDYYDYGYSARLRRFHQPHCYHNYWDDYYTNMYWYTYNPYDWGISIYMGYNWLWPSRLFYYNHYSPWYYGGMGWYGGYGWGYPYYSSPYYWGYGSSYYSGYYNGYWDGYWAGSHEYYYNTYDNNTYVGPRNPRSSTSGGKGSTKNLSFGERYQQAIAMETAPGKNTTRATDTKNTRYVTPAQDIRSTPATETRNTTSDDKVSRYTPAETTRQAQEAAPSSSTPITPKPEIRSTLPATGRQTQMEPTTREPASQPVIRSTTPPANNTRQTQERYYAPKNVTPATPVEQTPRKEAIRQAPENTQREYTAPAQERYSKPKDYYSPNFTKPKSSQEYVSPKTESMPATESIKGRSQPNTTRSYSSPPPKTNEYVPQRAPAQQERSTPPPRSESNNRSTYTPSSSPSSSGSSSGSSTRSSGTSRSSGTTNSSGSSNSTRGRR